MATLLTMGMEVAEDEAEVETLLKQIALAKQKELRLRAEKKRIRDEMGQLQAGTLWSREEQTQKQLLEVRRAKEQLEAQKKAEEEKLAKLGDNLREQEMRFRRGLQTKPSPFQQAAASVVAPTASPSQRAVSSSNQNENTSPLQTGNGVVSMEKRAPITKTPLLSPPSPSPPARPPDALIASKETNPQGDEALHRLIQTINCDELQKRIERLQVELETANSRRREAKFDSSPVKIARRSDTSSDTFTGSSGYPERDNFPENVLSSNQASPGMKTHDRQAKAVREAATKFIHLKPLEGQLPAHPSDPKLPSSNNTDVSDHASAVAATQPTAISGGSNPPQFVQEDDIRRLERELEMQRIANEQQAEAKEFARLQGRVQDLQTQISTLAVVENTSVQPIEKSVADEKENSALRSLKIQHLESLAKVRNERDLLEEQQKLEELKEQIQRRREEKKRELDHEEWVAKQKRELVALRLQRAIQHGDAKPDGRIELREESAEPYTPDNGFALFWDYAAGLPPTINDVQCLRHKLCSFLSFRHIKKLSAASDLRVIMEVAAVSQNGAGGPRVPTSLGWTAFEIFKQANEGELNLVCGSFRLPVKQASMPDPSKALVLPPTLNDCGDIRVHVRLVHGERVEEASRLVVDPESHAARYELPDTGTTHSKPQSRGMVARRPSIQGRRTPVVAAKPADNQKTTPSSGSAEHRTQVLAENGSAFSSTTSDAFEPTFDAYMEYRQSNFNPTLTLIIRVDTIELISKRPVILGYSAFPVFLDVETRGQPNRPSIPQFILNEGGFQLPLHPQVQSTEASQPLSAKSCDEFPRIPCATLLLRIVKAKLSADGLAVLSRKDFPPHEWETKGLLVPAPHYCDQFYDSLRCIPSGIEEKIYSIRHKNRRPKVVSQCLQQISLSTSEARDMLKVKPATYLDLTSALRYEPAIGFRVAVDALHNVKAKGNPFFKVVFSVYPPGSFYQAIRLTGDVYFTTTMDWTSTQTSPEFGDGYMTLRDAPPDQLLTVFFDVRSVTRHPKTGAYTSQQYGWTFLPVLAHSRSVSACTIQLPLFQGEVNLSILKAAVGGLGTLVDDIGNEKIKQLVPVAEDGASLFVRIQDPQLPHLSSQPIANACLSRMVPSRMSAKYAYDSAKIAALKKKAPVSKILPTNIPENQFEKEMNQAFAQEMGIHHLLF
ncbi:uncharacterized protein IUM83_12045 [Phytophthora cinnamomi]|uniref:uncharacterized protein n=1 Tax=Phytophthora cinnamomi TaxID=4785 RepID=UPI003559EBD1|nr:hypothetical protein IUM83_12045 [Phytophthora cinnamomi]